MPQKTAGNKKHQMLVVKNTVTEDVGFQVEGYRLWSLGLVGLLFYQKYFNLCSCNGVE